MVNLVDNVLDRLHLMIADSEADITLPQNWPVAVGYGPWVEEIWANYISNATFLTG
jgi:light-regulated signal transduction histidine kinase (bacteriophytochrome)